jgi:hypothetical protein
MLRAEPALLTQKSGDASSVILRNRMAMMLRWISDEPAR